MAQYATPSDRHVDVVEPIEGSAPLTVANPLPLGLGALAFTTAIIGCSYAGFIIPSIRTGTTLVVAFALFYGGLVQILAGMHARRQGRIDDLSHLSKLQIRAPEQAAPYILLDGHRPAAQMSLFQ